jgi:hypothetical protein
VCGFYIYNLNIVSQRLKLILPFFSFLKYQHASLNSKKSKLLNVKNYDSINLPYIINTNANNKNSLNIRQTRSQFFTKTSENLISSTTKSNYLPIINQNAKNNSIRNTKSYMGFIQIKSLQENDK